MTDSQVLLEYIWIDAYNKLRSKNRILYFSDPNYIGVKDLPLWNYDGSSTGQAVTESSEIVLKPVAIYKDPFRNSKLISHLVLCETFCVDKVTPHPTNTRHTANKTFIRHYSQEPWYGIEQEFFLINTENDRPLGFPAHYEHFPKEQGMFYCGVGNEYVFGRQFVEDCYEKCLYAGLKVSGMNGEVAPGQWEIQIGPCQGIIAGDQIYVMRYILKRNSENYKNIRVDFAAKPQSVSGTKWNGSGGHTNFSTKAMREIGGIREIYRAIEKLSEKHEEHIKVYGSDNHLRLTGGNETSDISKFSYGVGNRSASIRIPTETKRKGCGYLEDRRPSSSCDFYLVTSKLLETVME